MYVCAAFRAARHRGHHGTYGPGGVGLTAGTWACTRRASCSPIPATGALRATRENVMDGVGHFFERTRDNSYRSVNVMPFVFSVSACPFNCFRRGLRQHYFGFKRDSKTRVLLSTVSV